MRANRLNYKIEIKTETINFGKRLWDTVLVYFKKIQHKRLEKLVILFENCKKN